MPPVNETTTDNLNRANSVNDLGAAYSAVAGAAGELSIVSQAAVNEAGAYCASKVTTPIGDANQRVSFTLASLPTGAFANIAIFLGLRSTDTLGIRAVLDGTNASCQLVNETPIGASVANAWQVGDRYTFERLGTTTKLWRNRSGTYTELFSRTTEAVDGSVAWAMYDPGDTGSLDDLGYGSIASVGTTYTRSGLIAVGP